MGVFSGCRVIVGLVVLLVSLPAIVQPQSQVVVFTHANVIDGGGAEMTRDMRSRGDFGEYWLEASLTFVSWNEVAAWLRRLEGSEARREAGLTTLPFRTSPGIRRWRG